jgi:hypothetical protein
LIERIVEVFRQYEKERGVSVLGLGEGADERKRRTERESGGEIRDTFSAWDESPEPLLRKRAA